MAVRIQRFRRQTMKSYGQFCPVAKAAHLFCERWTPLIIRDLAAGAGRFSELQRGVPLMSPTLLSRRLKQLETEGVVERRRASQGKSWTYHLTPAGCEFVPLIEALGVWGQRWTRRQLAKDEVNLSLLIWTLERGVDATAFGAACTIVCVEFTDQIAAKSKWWFLNRDGACQLCLEDPGFEVDLYLTTTLPDLIYIVRGDVSLTRAFDEGRLEAIGPRALQSRLGAWLNLNPLAKVRSQRPDGRIGRRAA
jgi:DNA-binding HxlR family transcriptional regulator